MLFQRVWEESKIWRFECIGKSVEKTEENGGLGIQRMELIRHLGWEIGIPKNNTTITPSDVIKYCDKENKLAMEIFIKWLAECHHLVQANIFNTPVNFPVYSLEEDFLLDTIFPSPGDIKPNDNTNQLQCEVKLPPLKAMIFLDPEKIVSIRNELGAGHLEALQNWKEHPTDDNREDVVFSLKDYCNRLCKRYEKEYLGTLIATFSNSKNCYG